MRAFAPMFLHQKKFKPKMYVQKKLCAKLLYEKGGHKMLVKLTPAFKRTLSFLPPKDV
jgi:hypothetical protein